MRRTWWLAAALCAGALVVGAGCKSDSKKTDSTPVSGATAEGTFIDPTPFATPLINGNLVTSQGKGYAVTIPDGWHSRPNLIQTVDSSTDAYFEPTAQNGVQANISVVCLLNKDQTPDEWKASYKANVTRQGLNSNIREGTATIGGVPADVLDYTFQSQQAPGDPAIDKEDVLFSSGKCDWTVTTTARSGDRPTYKQQFDLFLSSFKLLP